MKFYGKKLSGPLILAGISLGVFIYSFFHQTDSFFLTSAGSFPLIFALIYTPLFLAFLTKSRFLRVVIFIVEVALLGLIFCSFALGIGFCYGCSSAETTRSEQFLYQLVFLSFTPYLLSLGWLTFFTKGKKK